MPPSKKDCFHCIFCQGEDCPNPYRCYFEEEEIEEGDIHE